MSSIPTNQSTPPVPLLTAHVRPNCPTLTKKQMAWLNKNAIIGYAQTVAAAQTQSSNSSQVRDPGTEYVKEHVLNVFLEEFWTPDNELKTVSILLKVRKYLANYHKAYSEKSHFDPCTQTHPAWEIKAEMAKHSYDVQAVDNLNLYCDMSSAMWNELDAMAIEEYQAMADEANACAAKPPSLSEIYCKATSNQISDPWSPSKPEDVSHNDDNEEDKEDETAKVEAALSNAAAAIKWRAEEKALAAEAKPTSSGDDDNVDVDEAEAGDKDDMEVEDVMEDDAEVGDNGDDEEEEDEMAKVQTALDNAATTLKCKEKAVKNREENVAKEEKEKTRGP
ncbi:uncharacterized protein ARMOST_20932 [Armillaria ostoyae]|uniref:Uncharacterized protein n=1 Tax=Armillaria ostoyae TaxID=47428 RepID=A0A284S8N8_ARMOS|nr:uncharacterized protein ARMOST_20932 [Armillaria ostoyae]